MRPKGTVSVPAGFDALDLDIPKPPRREGKHVTTATLTLRQGQEVLAKVPVTLELALGPEAAKPDLKKGEKVTFVIRRGQVEIRAAATANTDADVGDPVQVTVTQSSKVLKGKLTGQSPAVVEEVSP